MRWRGWCSTRAKRISWCGDGARRAFTRPPQHTMPWSLDSLSCLVPRSYGRPSPLTNVVSSPGSPYTTGIGPLIGFGTMVYGTTPPACSVIKSQRPWITCWRGVPTWRRHGLGFCGVVAGWRSLRRGRIPSRLGGSTIVGDYLNYVARCSTLYSSLALGVSGFNKMCGCSIA
jgi:hypothetical protein